MLCCVQNYWKSAEIWLSCWSSTSIRFTPTVRDLVWYSKCLSQSRTVLWSVYPFGVGLITQSWGISVSVYQFKRWTDPFTSRNGGSEYLSPLMQLIAVDHSRLPGWTFFFLLCCSEPVTTIVLLIRPIAKPVSSKLYKSLSWIPYFARMFSMSLNYVINASGSSHRAL